MASRNHDERELKEALRWWRPLADRGDAEAQWRIGEMYAQGKGLPQSPLNAIEWFYKAAQGFQKQGSRDRALMVLEDMRKADPTHPLTKKVTRQLIKP